MAQSAPNQGFQLNRYEPTAAGEWSFAVDHPWYSSTRSFAAGLTLNYAHKPLVFGFERNGFNEVRTIYDHQFIAHIDIAGVYPEVDDIRSFVADKNPKKREALVDQLLQRKEFTEGIPT